MAEVPKGARLRIVSDGFSPTTRIEVDGKPLTGVRSVTWSLTAPGMAMATLKVAQVDVDVFGRHIGTWQMKRNRCTNVISKRARRVLFGLRYALGRD